MSFTRYERYKESGVEWLGEVPAHWVIRRLKQVFREREERSTDGAETLLSVSAYTGVTPRSEIIEVGDHLSRAESLVDYKVCHADDLVVNIMLAWNRGLGFAAQTGIVSPAYCVYRVVDGSVPRFLNYLVRSDRLIGYFKAFSSGVIDSRLRIYPDVFGRLFCALPSPREQASIATFLDHETAKIDALVEEQKRLIKLLKEKRQAVISRAVTKGLDPNAPMKESGVEWLGAVPAHWNVVPAKRAASVFVPQRNKPEVNIDGDGVFWATMDDMGPEKIVSTGLCVSDAAALAAGSRILKSGAVIASCVGSFGVASINSVDLVINQQLQAYVPKTVIKAEYLRYCLCASEGYFAKVATAATIAYVNQQGFESFPLALPPLTEQVAVVSFLVGETIKIDSLLSEAVGVINLLQERRTALISAAVTGKIDVRSKVKPPEPALA